LGEKKLEFSRTEKTKKKKKHASHRAPGHAGTKEATRLSKRHSHSANSRGTGASSAAGLTVGVERGWQKKKGKTTDGDRTRVPRSERAAKRVGKLTVNDRKLKRGGRECPALP